MPEPTRHLFVIFGFSLTEAENLKSRFLLDRARKGEGIQTFLTVADLYRQEAGKFAHVSRVTDPRLIPFCQYEWGCENLIGLFIYNMFA